VIMSINDFASIKNITIKNNISSQSSIVADVVMLQVVLRNLLTNAIKFTHDSGLVTIDAETGDLYIKLIVRDNGTGMSDSQIRNFNTISYSQFLESTPGTNKEKGTGLGLMLSKNFATLMNGTIHVESAKNEGTTFSLSLPKRINLN
jgi:signal transduction histidine kinase